MIEPRPLVLFSGPHCELCDQAKDLIYQSLPHGSYGLMSIDVTESLWLKKHFGLRIPVLWLLDEAAKEFPRHVELVTPVCEWNWPFTGQDLQQQLLG